MYFGYSCSNRTFMELKYNKSEAEEQKAKSSNRTFMELKLNNLSLLFELFVVLIAPLWN